MQNSLEFEHKCVLAVCVHNHTIMIKIHPVFFFKFPQIIRSQIKPFTDSWQSSSAQAPPTTIDWHGRFSIDPPWESCLPLFRCRSRCRQNCLLSDWGVLLLDVIMNIAVVMYSWHLSPGAPLRILGPLDSIFTRALLPSGYGWGYRGIR